mgnify:CR=1 FL=1
MKSPGNICFGEYNEDIVQKKERNYFISWVFIAFGILDDLGIWENVPLRVYV